METYSSAFMRASYRNSYKLSIVNWKKPYPNEQAFMEDSLALVEFSRETRPQKMIFDTREFDLPGEKPDYHFLKESLGISPHIGHPRFLVLLSDYNCMKLFWFFELLRELLPYTIPNIINSLKEARDYLQRQGKQQRMWPHYAGFGNEDLNISFEHDPENNRDTVHLNFDHGNLPFYLLKAKGYVDLLKDCERYKDSFTEITLSEFLVLTELCRCYNLKSVAEQMNVSEGTVKKHMDNVREKLQLSNPADIFYFGTMCGVR